MTTVFLGTSPLSLGDFLQVGLPETVALAAVALVGYLFGHRTRSAMLATLDERRQRELDRAMRIAWQLEKIADALRQDLVAHHSRVGAFKRRIGQAQAAGNERSWELLCSEAEAMLGPTMELAQHLSHAYDQIRQQSDALETFTQGRTDPLTGVGNSRALEQHLRVLFGAAARGSADFAIALVSLDRDTSTPEGRSLASILPALPKLASVIRTCMRRDTDMVARYGDEEFVIVMPQTTLAGARVFVDRLRKRVADDLASTVCCGLAQAQAGDDSRSLLTRADSALYSAKAAGHNRLFIHSGTQIREHHTTPGVPSGATVGGARADDYHSDAEAAVTDHSTEELALETGA